jgi:N-acetylglutamate synthase-like GNAT family acetyltransferase
MTRHHVDLLAASQCNSELIEAACRMLHTQWPRGGSIADYCKKLVVEDSPNIASLPCSYLLIQKEGGNEKSNAQVVGHCRLTECFEGAGGSAAAATYVIVQPRGQGYGSQLMALLEKEAVKLGYHYVYLWTASAVPFYQKIGYSQTKRISLFSACLKTLDCDQVNQLEEMLAKRAGGPSKKHETVMLPPDEATDNDVWLRKRLVESVASVVVPLEQRIEELQAAIQQQPQPLAWEYSLRHVPWQQQVGPSCGLAALRMLREHYVVTGEDSKMPSLLVEAQRKGYSVDGEIFDANRLVQLTDFCGLQTKLLSFQATSPVDVLAVLKVGGTMILPYDSQASTKRPCQNSGLTAHYGIIVGIMFGYPTEDFSTSSLREHTDHDVDEAEAVLLLVQHSLSPKLAIASWSDFFESNQQLVMMDKTKYKLYDGAYLNLRDCLIVCHGSAGQ